MTKLFGDLILIVMCFTTHKHDCFCQSLTFDFPEGRGHQLSDPPAFFGGVRFDAYVSLVHTRIVNLKAKSYRTRASLALNIYAERQIMANFVLVHGAMHGGWAWRCVADQLETRGHQVFTPTLTGQGERRHLLTRSVGIDTHIEDIDALLYYEDLSEVILVLHSYAGVLAGPLAERCAERIQCTALAGGFYARPGESLQDLEPESVVNYYREQVDRHGQGWYLPATDAFLTQWAITNELLQGFVAPRLTDFPYKCIKDKVDYAPQALIKQRRVYIEHTNPPLASLHLSLIHALEDGFEHQSIDTGHDMMLADPDGTAAVLLDLAS